MFPRQKATGSKLIGKEERTLTAKLDGKIVGKRKEVGVLSGRGQEGAVKT